VRRDPIAASKRSSFAGESTLEAGGDPADKRAGGTPVPKKDELTPQTTEAPRQPRQCFFIAPIGPAGSETRKRSDQIFKHVLTPICEEIGYGLVRADRIADAGRITTQVVEHLIQDELVVADLSGRNPNVFYELAIRHVVRKPFVQLMGMGEDLPFDVAAMRTVFLDIHDLDSVAEAKADIADQIRSFQSGKLQLTTPISHALDWEKLRGSNDPEQHVLADLVTAVNELRGDMRRMQRGQANNFDVGLVGPDPTNVTTMRHSLISFAQQIAAETGYSLNAILPMLTKYPAGWSPTELSDQARVLGWVREQIGRTGTEPAQE
jgi:hypothetical protein